MKMHGLDLVNSESVVKEGTLAVLLPVAVLLPILR